MWENIWSDLILQVQKAEQGEINPLDAYIELKDMAEYIDNQIKHLKESAIIEAEKYKGDTYRGYQVDVRNVGGRYDYSHIVEICDLKAQIKELEKMAQASYKNGLKGLQMMSNDAELIQPAKYTDGSLAIVLKKINK
jgi:hypothetical protein